MGLISLLSNENNMRSIIAVWHSLARSRHRFQNCISKIRTANNLAHRHLTTRRRPVLWVCLTRKRLTLKSLEDQVYFDKCEQRSARRHLTWFTEYTYILTSESINSKADVEVSVLFEWDEEGDRGVNGGDKSRVCERFLLLPACLGVAWLVLFVPKGPNWDVIIKLNSRSVLNVL